MIYSLILQRKLSNQSPSQELLSSSEKPKKKKKKKAKNDAEGPKEEETPISSTFNDIENDVEVSLLRIQLNYLKEL